MSKPNYDEQIANVQKKLDIQKARLKELKAKQKTEARKQERKDRTHRLIQIGAICEEVYGDAISEGAMQEALRQFLRDQDARGMFYSKKLNEAKEKAAAAAGNADDAADFNPSWMI